MTKTELIPTIEVADLLGVHVRTVHRMVAAGRLKPKVKVPGLRGAYLFSKADVQALASRDRVESVA